MATPLRLDYLWSVLPDYATNSQITSSRQQVYMLTQELMRAKLIRGK